MLQAWLLAFNTAPHQKANEPLNTMPKCISFISQCYDQDAVAHITTGVHDYGLNSNNSFVGLMKERRFATTLDRLLEVAPMWRENNLQHMLDYFHYGRMQAVSIYFFMSHNTN